ncbi:MAG: cbb3-type cytochrome c oxidase N-terminal domain-containing protein [Oligoflexus sp.]
MADKRDVERPYVVDGIKEYDNPLPPWWVFLFYFTIAFSVVYMIYIHMFDGRSLDDELVRDREQHAAFLAEQAKQRGADEGSLAERMSDPQLVEAGAVIYQTNCSPCHGAQGQGVVGPNLTDNYWIHGGSADDILRVIADGVTEKGMIPWRGILGPQKMEEVTAYVMSLSGTEPPNPKAPEGEVYEGSAATSSN